MHSTVRRITHPSRLGRRAPFDREDEASRARRPLRSRGRSHSYPSPLHSRRSLDALAAQPTGPEPSARDERWATARGRSTIWLGTWHSSRGTTAVNIRLGQRGTGGFVLHLVVRIGQDPLHRLLFPSDAAEVAALVNGISAELVSRLQLPPLEWNDEDSDGTAA